MGALLAITTVPDEATAVKISNVLLNERLAACVHVCPAGRSIYRWQGKLEESVEYTLLIKTTEERWPEIEVTLSQHHPYQLPELIGIPLGTGSEPYLRWLTTETAKHD